MLSFVFNQSPVLCGHDLHNILRLLQAKDIIDNAIELASEGVTCSDCTALHVFVDTIIINPLWPILSDLIPESPQQIEWYWLSNKWGFLGQKMLTESWVISPVVSLAVLIELNR